MKKRIGFVSNSSSSSFICDITKEEFEGHELTAEEAGVVEYSSCKPGVDFDYSKHVGGTVLKKFIDEDIKVEIPLRVLLESYGNNTWDDEGLDKYTTYAIWLQVKDRLTQKE